MSITIVRSLAEATALRPGRRLLFAGRVSDEDDEDKSYGLEIQEDDVRQFSHDGAWDLIADPAYSGYESGRIPLEMRQIYQRIKRDAKLGKFDAVCFGRINRIARRSYFSLQLIEELKEVGVEVLTADLRVDTTQPAGEYVRQIMIATAEFDASSILKNTAAGREKRLKTGKPWLARRMYGYRYTRPSAMGKNDGAATKHEEEARTIIWMFECRAAHWSHERIAAQLTADGKPSPAGKKAWSAATVRHILNNEAYRGTGTWGKHKNARSANGKRTSHLRRDGHQLYEMEYPRIVSDDLWAAAHDPALCAIGLRPTKTCYLFRGGMVRCAEHGTRMTGTLGGNGVGRYRCVRLPKGDRATRHMHVLAAPRLEEAVWSEFLRFLADPERGRRGVRDLIVQREQAVAAEEVTLAGLRQRESTMTSKIDAILDLDLSTPLAKERAKAKIAQLEGDLEQVRREIRQAEARLTLARVDLPAIEEVAEACRRLSKGAHYADDDAKRELFDAVQLQVWVKGDEFWADGILPGLHLEGKLATG